MLYLHLPLNQNEREQISIIRKHNNKSRFLNLSDEDNLKCYEVLMEMKTQGVIQDAEIDNCNAYLITGSIIEFINKVESESNKIEMSRFKVGTIDSIDDAFLTCACSVLADTNKGLSGRQIVDKCSSFAIRYGRNIPQSNYPFVPRTLPKSSALKQNLESFSADEQLQIIYELCESSKFYDSIEIVNLLEYMKEKYSSVISDNAVAHVQDNRNSISSNDYGNRNTSNFNIVRSRNCPSKQSMATVDDKHDAVINLIQNRLRLLLHKVPETEKDVQNALENLFVGYGWNKGEEYDRETGKFIFAGREYIPDFIVQRMNLCLEVKLLKNGKKSKVIEEINADITAYSKEYKRLLFIVYDLGVIRDENEFIRDIENAKENVRVLIIKH